jgi:hypothetical protein
MDGDGFVDLVDAEDSNGWRVYRGGPTGMTSSSSLTWQTPVGTLPDALRDEVYFQNQNPAESYWGVARDTLDLTGDGIPDFVDALTGAGNDWLVYPGFCSATGCGFATPPIGWHATPGEFLEIRQNNGAWTTRR